MMLSKSSAGITSARYCQVPVGLCAVTCAASAHCTIQCFALPSMRYETATSLCFCCRYAVWTNALRCLCLLCDQLAIDINIDNSSRTSLGRRVVSARHLCAELQALVVVTSWAPNYVRLPHSHCLAVIHCSPATFHVVGELESLPPGICFLLVLLRYCPAVDKSWSYSSLHDRKTLVRRCFVQRWKLTALFATMAKRQDGIVSCGHRSPRYKERFII